MMMKKMTKMTTMVMMLVVAMMMLLVVFLMMMTTTMMMIMMMVILKMTTTTTTTTTMMMKMSSVGLLSLQVYYIPLLTVHDQRIPPLLTTLPIMRYIFLREQISIVHGHGVSAVKYKGPVYTKRANCYVFVTFVLRSLEAFAQGRVGSGTIFCESGNKTNPNSKVRTSYPETSYLLDNH